MLDENEAEDDQLCLPMWSMCFSGTNLLPFENEVNKHPICLALLLCFTLKTTISVADGVHKHPAPGSTYHTGRCRTSWQRFAHKYNAHQLGSLAPPVFLIFAGPRHCLPLSPKSAPAPPTFPLTVQQICESVQPSPAILAFDSGD